MATSQSRGGGGNPCTPRVPSVRCHGPGPGRDRAVAPRWTTYQDVLHLSRAAGRAKGRAKYGPCQDAESAADQATCVATESTTQMRVYGTVWLAKKMPAAPRNHAGVEARTDGEATRQFDLPSSLAYAGPGERTPSEASELYTLLV